MSWETEPGFEHNSLYPILLLSSPSHIISFANCQNLLNSLNVLATLLITSSELSFLLLYYNCIGGILRHLQKFLQCIIFEFTSPSFSFLPHPTIPGIVLTCLSFSIFIHEYIIFLLYITLLHPFLTS
jgi:hypothetical protein